MEFNKFTEKTLENQCKKDCSHITGLRILEDKGREIDKWTFVFEFSFGEETRYGKFKSSSLDMVNKPFGNNVSFDLSGYAEILKNETIDFDFIKTQFIKKYLYYTGRLLSAPFHKSLRKLDEDIKNILDEDNLNLLNISGKLKSKLYKNDIFMDDTIEASFFENEKKRDWIQAEKCGRCEEMKILRDSEWDCCDVCAECYEIINYAHKNVLKRTHDAVGYLRGTQNNDPKLEMAAFLSIFHPELSESKAKEMIRDAK